MAQRPVEEVIIEQLMEKGATVEAPIDLLLIGPGGKRASNPWLWARFRPWLVPRRDTEISR
jgi:hypothetical protein